MKAMIFAAGLGTRLKPLTDNMPKALVKVNGKTMLEHVIEKLIKFGYFDIIINVHHFAEQIKDFLIQKNNFGINIMISDESAQLLDTGGGLKKASWFFDNNKPFLVYNADVLSDIDINFLYKLHIQNNSLATLVVRQRITSRYFLFDNMFRLCGWKNVKTGEVIISRDKPECLTQYAFSGIQIIEPKIFELINETGKFSLTELYIKLATYNNINGFVHNTGYWFDLGKLENINEAENMLYNRRYK